MRGVGLWILAVRLYSLHENLSTSWEIGDRFHFWRQWSLEQLVSLLESCPPAALSAPPNSRGCDKDGACPSTSPPARSGWSVRTR